MTGLSKKSSPANPLTRRCPRCRASAEQCARIGEHFPYRDCCKACRHSPEETTQEKEVTP